MRTYRKLSTIAAAATVAGGLALTGTSAASTGTGGSTARPSGASAGGTVLGVTTGVSDAAPVAYNYKTQYLTQNPVDSMGTSCVDRPIQLAAGNYNWAQFLGGAVDIVRPNFYLGAGRYTWTDCLDPKDGYYVQTTWLNPDNPNWPTASASGPWTLYSSGNFTWGSYLDPLFSSSSAEEKAPDHPSASSPQAERRGG
ncbi:hypothetical protein [Nonomuraea sp. LPB2021202275-12-8]|uniref:hypothetical protein n=1 Tax=Nonomuraea sp. LPB2021202275-12-8 TaxID=3120159 RepID=UPI00300D1622